MIIVTKSQFNERLNLKSELININNLESTNEQMKANVSKFVLSIIKTAY